MNSKKKYLIIITLLIIILLFCLIFGITIGTSNVSASDVYEVIFKTITNQDTAHIDNSIVDIIIEIRLPRMLLAVIVGAGLAVAGLCMQAIVRNPLADPFIVGISSGAQLGATLAIMLGIGSIFGQASIGASAFIGALSMAILVVTIANVDSSNNTSKLLLIGMALSSFSSAVANLIIYLTNNQSATQKLMFWMMGSLAGANYTMIIVLAVVLTLCLMFLIFNSRILDLMLLGDESAITLGFNLSKYRMLFLIIVALMVGLIVYSSGIIGFVGLIIPHFTRMFVKNRHILLIPINALIGSIFMVVIDLVSRSILVNSEVPIGILVAAIGAPVFVYLMTSKTYKFGGN